MVRRNNRQTANITNNNTYIRNRDDYEDELGEEEEADGVDMSECGMEAYPEFTN